MRVPIAVKLIVLVVTFLIVATAIFTTTSSNYMEAYLTLREEYSNQKQVQSQDAVVRLIVDKIIERAQTIGKLMVKQTIEKKIDFNDPTKINELDEVMINFNDSNLVAIEVLKLQGSGFQVVNRKVREEFFKQNAAEGSNYIQKLRNIQKFPVRSVFQKKIEIRNSTLSKGPALISLGAPLLKDDNNNVAYIVVVDFELAVLQKIFSEPSERVQFMVDRNGNLLAHQEEQKAFANYNVKESPLVQKSFSDSELSRQMQFIDPETQKTNIGAYIRSSDYGITVFSQTSKDVILEPAIMIRRDAYYVTGQVISVAIFVVFVLSVFLTGPIEKLAHLIQYVSKGNFNVKARAQVRSNDEVGDLAIAFDKMTEGLKERDKIKNALVKYHGSSIAEDLLKNEMSLGGQSKEVTVFFSDIRGFTSFSENHSPEQVIEMLNEYFTIMVNIVTRHHGVVDKFIGDAIMAVWGVPRRHSQDTANAVRACIEMRRSLQDLNQKREMRGQNPIMIGIGLHCGRVISGNIGSDERMELTVIGDTVNMTSRIESSTKAFGADLLVSEAIVAKVSNDFLFEVAGTVEVKGKAEPITLYRVRGYKENDNWIEVKTNYSDYEAGDADKVKVAG